MAKGKKPAKGNKASKGSFVSQVVRGFKESGAMEERPEASKRRGKNVRTGPGEYSQTGSNYSKPRSLGDR